MNSDQVTKNTEFAIVALGGVALSLLTLIALPSPDLPGQQPVIIEKGGEVVSGVVLMYGYASGIQLVIDRLRGGKSDV